MLLKIKSRSSWNPIFNISSASSSTTANTVSIFNAFRFNKSTKRPGVATTTCTPFCNSFICLLISVPPYTQVTRISGRYFEYFFKSLPICIHNSRVGLRTNICTLFHSGLIFCNNGNPKAAVFPVPVWANTTKSFSSPKITGMAFSCTGLGVSNPKSAIPLRISPSNPNSLNFSIKLF